MKICLLNAHHEPLDKRMFHKLGKSLVHAGHEVVSIAPRAPELPVSLVQNEAQHEGVAFRFLPSAHSRRERLRNLFLLIARGRCEKADVHIAPEPESWVAALIIKFLAGGKAVLDMHEHIQSKFSEYFPRPMRPFVAWLTVRFMRLFARYTDLIILTRKSFEDCWEGLATPRVLVLNTNHLQPPCAAVPDSVRSLCTGDFILLHQGLFGDVRGSWQLLDAMKLLTAALPQARCIVLGKYEYGSEQAYRSAINEAGLHDALVMVDAVPFEEVPAYIAAAQIGLILFQPGKRNHTLAMPHKLFDYMREGRPVIAPDFAVEVAAIVREADCGVLVDVTSPAAIAEAILRLRDNPDEMTRLGANGRRAVETTYNWQRDEAELLRAIARLDSSR